MKGINSLSIAEIQDDNVVDRWREPEDWLPEATTKKSTFLLDLQKVLVYSSATLQVRNIVKALMAFSYAGVSPHSPYRA